MSRLNRFALRGRRRRTGTVTGTVAASGAVIVLLLLACAPLRLPGAVAGEQAVASHWPLPREGTPPSDLAAPLACDPDKLQDSGAWYRICMPSFPPWNGDLVVYAHGYVSPTEPVGIPEEQMVLPSGASIPGLINALGYAFATTSYSTNGLAVVEGMADLVDLVDLFTAEKGVPDKVYLLGVSEGGLITVLLMEQRADVFDGGLAACGPYGDFVYQTNYIGDFRIVFDYFFPDLMPPSPVDIPQWLLDGWDAHYDTNIEPEIQDPANAVTVTQLLTVTHAAHNPEDPSTTIYRLLWFNALGTNDAGQKLGGQPFDNMNRLYAGSDDDARLNQAVQRFSADQAALDELDAHYQTSGQLSVPLVTMHTTGDPVVPHWHANRYRGKTIHADNVALHEHFDVERYGHCTFEGDEVLEAFWRLVEMVENPPPYRPVKRAFLPLVLKNQGP